MPVVEFNLVSAKCQISTAITDILTLITNSIVLSPTEWFLCAQAILRIGATIATLYASLGEEAIVFGINETEVTHIITTQDLLPKLSKIKSRIPKVNTVVYIEGIKPLTTNGFGPEIQLVSYKQLLTDGRGAPPTLSGVDPSPDDVAVILYTSGVV